MIWPLYLSELNNSAMMSNMKKNFFEHKNILITGGAGFIGANLARRLLAENAIVHLLIKKNTNIWRIKAIKKDIYIHHINLDEQQKLKNLIRKNQFEYIFHLASHGSNSYQTDIQEMISTNIVGLSNLLLALNDTSYKAIINTGSSSEYGFKDHPMKESDILSPNSFYSSTKGSATLLSQTFAKIYDKPVVTLRPFSIYGPGEPKERFIPTAINAFLTDTPINLTPGLQRRDFVYINDFIDTYLIAAQKANGIKGEIINVGTGVQHTNDDIVKILEKLFKKTVPIHKGNYPKRSWDSTTWVADTKKAKKLLGWEAKYSLAKGLAQTIQWMKK